ncbi:MAG: diguanylate cyclase [Eubacteriales bacterium]|nr:diguanylate cyclase [Eubacteriales bacterium]
MNFSSNIILNTYSIVILIIILNHTFKSAVKDTVRHKLFIIMLLVTILMLVVDIFSRFDGNPDSIYSVFNHFGNFLIFLLSPVLPSLWLLYVYDQVFHEKKKMKRLFYPLITINAVNAILLILSQFFGWFYTIDSNNIYHRGPFFLIPISFTFALIFMAFTVVIVNRKKIEKKYYFSLLFFAIPPFTCIIMQIILYGLSLILNSVVISILIAFLYIQNQDMHTDFLTGVNNRKKLEAYLKKKINTSNENKTFSAILLDINNFKSINDTFGHDMGDDALETAVKLLKSCLKPSDFIARFGGDEFYIILDESNRDELEATVSRINNCIEKYNETSLKPYRLGFSMGYAVYDYRSQMEKEQFQKQIDTLMYQNKRANKEL